MSACNEIDQSGGGRCYRLTKQSSGELVDRSQVRTNQVIRHIWASQRASRSRRTRGDEPIEERLVAGARRRRLVACSCLHMLNDETPRELKRLSIVKID
ncbi:hypothetical protein chiPu_0019209 [Chiloscyllium punctatum]|uniref:Uncharacterized protein n=1 Tax=Chiloscyllium punctatum TaxID=137246 RepID=A0A401RR54_CHIPU|nr:hypothetical protein [Chiloscyllium punctatum]